MKNIYKQILEWVPFAFVIFAIIAVETLFSETSPYIIFSIYVLSFIIIYCLTILIIYLLSISESPKTKEEIKNEIVRELKSTWKGAVFGILFGLILVLI